MRSPTDHSTDHSTLDLMLGFFSTPFGLMLLFLVALGLFLSTYAPPHDDD